MSLVLLPLLTLCTHRHTSRARAYTRMSLGKLRKDYGVVAAKHYHTAVLDPRWRACYFRCSDCSFPCFLRNTFVLMMRLFGTLVRFVTVGIFSLFHLPTLKTHKHTHTRAVRGEHSHTARCVLRLPKIRRQQQQVANSFHPTPKDPFCSDTS